ncbi:helix-turn-helix domain-containing protein [Deinococcus alpinitundrae]|uniref:helix-turn-helix domain-containing protein n=1 Tax=Deinococcus alpinitundrae TaxID=468913 RepID=UPI00137B6D8B|nr:helix-turn-helix domain-containing protein [Deinococcus alpinitundrae]
MTHHAEALKAWARLPLEIREVASPIETESQYQQALELFEEVWNEVGENAGHPLGSLFALLRDRLTAYEERHHPVPAAPAHRVLAYLMDQRDLRQTQLAEVLGITQGNVSRLLSGQTPFSVETVRRLAEYFNTSPQVFLG